MKYQDKIIWTFLRALFFWLVGLMNTVFIRTSDIGTVKNYLGYILLFLGILDTIFLVSVLLNKASYQKVKSIFLKILALTIPFYFIYFPQLHEDSDNPEIRILWRYVLTGIFIYIAVSVTYFIIK